MHFSTIAATAALVGSVLASGEYVYTTQSEAVYSTVSTCTEEAQATPTTPVGYYSSSEAQVYSSATPYSSAPSYETTSAAVYSVPSSSATPYEVTYTSHTLITITSCEAYITNCPAKTYSSAVYSVSTCTEESQYSSATPYSVPSSSPSGYAAPSSVPYYQAPSNSSAAVVTSTPCPTSTPVSAATPSSSPATLTNTYYTTVCPGANYCYGTTVTSTYCPSTAAATPSSVSPVKPSTVVPPPAYTSVSTSKNSTTTSVPAPYQTGAASINSFSLGAAALAALVAFIAA